MDLTRFHASARKPQDGEVHIIWQCYAYGPSAATTAERMVGFLRQSLPGSWLSQPFAIITVDNRSYWWNSGGVTEEFLLADRSPQPGEFVIVWEAYVKGSTFDDVARQAGEQLLGPVQVSVTDSSGSTDVFQV